MKRTVYRAVSRLHSALFSAPPRPGLRVLLYHSVGTTLPEDPYGTSISRERFTDHVAALKRLAAELEPSVFDAPSGDKPRLAITFDDGYKDVLATSAPLLSEAGIPFTVFVTSSFLDDPAGLYLSSAELKELAAMPGARVGAHGTRHVPLTGLDDDALREELAGSRKKLEDIIGQRVDSLSYPHGAVDRRVRDAAHVAGYVLGGCSRYGLNPAGRDPLLLCRTEVTAWDDSADLELKVRGHWDWFRFRRPDPAA